MLWITHACHFSQQILYVCLPCSLCSALISSQFLSWSLFCVSFQNKWAIHFHNVFSSTCIQLNFWRAGSRIELRESIEKWLLLLSLWLKTWEDPLSSSTFFSSIPSSLVKDAWVGILLGNFGTQGQMGEFAGRMGIGNWRVLFRPLHGISSHPQNTLFESILGPASCPVILFY